MLIRKRTQKNKDKKDLKSLFKLELKLLELFMLGK